MARKTTTRPARGRPEPIAAAEPTATRYVFRWTRTDYRGFTRTDERVFDLYDGTDWAAILEALPLLMHKRRGEAELLAADGRRIAWWALPLTTPRTPTLDLFG
jgi:hypothetical protein